MVYQIRKLKLHGKTGEGKFAIVDIEDFEKLNQFRWYMDKNNYVHRSQHISGSGKNRKKKTISLHRYLINPPKGKIIDHADRNPLNNLKSNLRICTRSQNEANSPGRGGTSEYKGVSWDREKLKWLAGIKHQYERIYIGVFKNEIDAAKAYNKKAKELFGEFACLNQV